MTMTVPENANDLLAKLDVDTDVERADVKAVAVLNRSEVEAQLDAAHRHPRQIKHFLKESLTLATLTRPVAESCIYSLPRGGKAIAGPSVRLAEIIASAYGNLHVAARIIDVEDTVVVAQGVAWDLEKNLRVTVEVRRRITDKRGRRYDDDMITVTGNAAASIALRNAIFRVVPRAYVDSVYEKVRETAVGSAMTLADRRFEVVTRLQKIGVPVERIYARLGKASIEDVGLEDVETLIGLGTAVKSGDVSIDAAFPPVGAATMSSATVKDLEAKIKASGRDFAAEAADIKDALADAYAGGTKRTREQARAMFEAWAKQGAPPELVDEVTKFAEMVKGEKGVPQ